MKTDMRRYTECNCELRTISGHTRIYITYLNENMRSDKQTNELAPERAAIRTEAEIGRPESTLEYESHSNINYNDNSSNCNSATMHATVAPLQRPHGELMMKVASCCSATANECPLLAAVSHVTCFKWAHSSLAECELLRWEAQAIHPCPEHEMKQRRGPQLNCIHFRNSFFIWAPKRELKLREIRAKDEMFRTLDSASIFRWNLIRWAQQKELLSTQPTDLTSSSVSVHGLCNGAV
jgi:hypothetical protein